MTDYNRRVKNDSWANNVVQCTVNVHGNTEISQGDFLFLDRVDGLRKRGTSTKDYYAYPFSDISGTTLTLDSNKLLAAENFLGIATWHSDSGVTEEISVELEGLFRYPLKLSRTVKTGYTIVPVGSGTTLYSQKVGVDSEAGVTYAIGKSAESGKFKSSIDMFIKSRVFNAGAYVAV